MDDDENVKSSGREVKKRPKRLQASDVPEEASASVGTATAASSIPASELFR